MRFLDFSAHSADYARYHTHPKNRLCHAVGIPLIMLAIVHWTFPLPLLVLPLYAAWHPRLALLMAGVLFAMALVKLPLAWLFFTLGWIFQFIGHAVYEKKSPAFARNLIHLLVGPLWILQEISLVISAQHGIMTARREQGSPHRQVGNTSSKRG